METSDGYEDFGDMDMLLHFQLQLQSLVFPIPCSPTSLYSSVMSLSNSWKSAFKRSPQTLLNDEVEEEGEDEEEELEAEKIRLVDGSSTTFYTMSTSSNQINQNTASSSPKHSFNSDRRKDEHIDINRPIVNNTILYNSYPRYNGSDSVPRSSFGGLCDNIKSKWENSHCHPLSWLLSLFPILVWLPQYKWKRHLTNDLIAGFTVAIMHIPQGMAYAQLANLPPIVGIYMGFFPVIMYSMVGTSRHVSMGTFAVVCLMTGKVAMDKLGDYSFVSSTMNSTLINTTSLQKDFTTGFYKLDNQYTIVEIATAISFSVGIWQVAMGFLRLGSLSLLLSSELVSGFTTGAAFHVLTSQVKGLLGLTVKKRNGIFKIPLMWMDIFINIKTVNYMAFGLSSVTVFTLLFYSELLKPSLCKGSKFPLPVELITVVVGTVISYYFSLHDNFNIEIVNYIPTGLPAPVPPPMKVVPNVIFDSFIIAAVAYVISISMAKVFAMKHNYTVEANQELFANGTSNLIGSCFSCAPISASLSRSLIQDQVGGKTQLAGLFSCGILVFVLLWLGPYFETLPSCILSAMIIVALKGMLVQVHDFPKAWQESVMNGCVWMTTFVSTVVLDIEYGLGVGLAMSIGLLVFRSNKPQLFVVGSYNSSDIYIDPGKSESVKELPGLRIIKCTGSLNFATMEKFFIKLKLLAPYPKSFPFDDKPGVFHNRVLSSAPAKSNITEEFDTSVNIVVTDKTKWPKPEHWLILDFSSLSAIDPGAVKCLATTNAGYAMRRVQILFCGCCDPVLDTMNTCGLIHSIGANSFFPLVHDAVVYAKAKISEIIETLMQSNKLDNPTLSIESRIITVCDMDHLDPLED